MEKKLTPKEELFCLEYVKDFNATAAATRAGYKASKSLHVYAFKLAGRDVIRERIEAIKAKMVGRLEVTGERILKEIARLALSDMKQYATWNGWTVTLMDSEKVDGACVKSIQQTKDGVKITLYDKNPALEMLKNHFFKNEDGGALQKLKDLLVEVAREGKK
jgi:phage terminase small subunit